jgi:hypothetical protein
MSISHDSARAVGPLFGAGEPGPVIDSHLDVGPADAVMAVHDPTPNEAPGAMQGHIRRRGRAHAGPLNNRGLILV